MTTTTQKPLLYDAISRELLYAARGTARADVTPLLNALRGIASCGTACKCCAMHQQIAKEAVERWEHNGHLKRCLSLDNVLGRHGCDCR